MSQVHACQTSANSIRFFQSVLFFAARLLDQKDSDSLPPYDVLDAILEAFIEDDLSVDEIVARGFERAIVGRVLEMVKRNEYKRRQAPPGIRISGRAFGRDWRYPITSGYRSR